MNEFKLLKEALLALDQKRTEDVLEELSKDCPPLELIEKFVVPVLDEIGSEWEEGTAALSQLYMSGKICEDLINNILPASAPERISQPNIAIATLCDYHILGKRIVYSILRSGGYELLDYKTIGVEELVSKVIEDKIQVLLISTLMLPSGLRVKEVRDALNAKEYSVKIIVGGAPFRFDPNLYKAVEADAMCNQASEVLATIKKVAGGNK